MQQRTYLNGWLFNTSNSISLLGIQGQQWFAYSEAFLPRAPCKCKIRQNPCGRLAQAPFPQNRNRRPSRYFFCSKGYYIRMDLLKSRLIYISNLIIRGSFSEQVYKQLFCHPLIFKRHEWHFLRIEFWSLRINQEWQMVVWDHLNIQ